MKKLNFISILIQVLYLFLVFIGILRFLEVPSLMFYIYIGVFIVMFLGLFGVVIPKTKQDKEVKWCIISYTLLWAFVVIVFNHNVNIVEGWWLDFMFFTIAYIVSFTFIQYCQKLDLITYKKGRGKKIAKKKLKKIKK